MRSLTSRSALPVDDWVPPGPEDPQKAVFPALQDAQGDQAGERFVVYRLGAVRHMLHPVAGVALLPGRDVGQRRV